MSKLFAQDILRGLTAAPKRLSSRYFYDDAGSRIFQEIMQLEEYYLTRCELEILENYSRDMAQLLASKTCNIIELGGGDGQKTVRLLQGFIESGTKVRYSPIDISKEAIQMLQANIKQKLPTDQIAIHGVVAEYNDGLRSLTRQNKDINLVVFLGSNIGNFEPKAAQQMFQQVREFLHPGDYMLTGFDLKKDERLLQAAYDDPRGVTARFNLNLLTRINRELGGNFDLNEFRHEAAYNSRTGAMESWLISQSEQKILIEALQQSFSFAAGERLHTEYSYKYDLAQVERYASDAGFTVIEHYQDSKDYFLDSLWQVKEPL